MKMLGKQGKGHIEMIISFVMFIGFVFFIFIAFNPVADVRSTEIIDSVFFNLEEDLTIELNRVTIQLNEPPGWQPGGGTGIAQCARLNGLDILISDMNCINDNLKVQDGNGNIIQSFIPSSNDAIKILTTQTLGPQGIYTITCSEETDGNSVNPGSCDTYIEGEAGLTYNLGIIVDETVWSESKLDNFINNDYANNYDTIKEDYIKEGNDFRIILWDLNDQKIVEAIKPIPDNTEVISRTIPIDVLDNPAIGMINAQGEIGKYKLSVVVW